MTAAAGAEPVPFVDLARQHGPIAGELDSALRRVAARGDFILGEDVARFEEEFAAYLGATHAVGVGSGTAAISIALTAAGIGQGDEVIVPAHTYIASALGVLHAGAEPVLCDVDPETGLIDLDAAEGAVGSRTAAVLVVHLYGQVADLERAAAFAARHGVALIEDAAQAHGARWKETMAGGVGLASAFSFYPSKNLGAFGDGGLVATSDAEVAAAARRLRNLGQERKGEHVVAGYNERLDTLQAAVLRAKLPHLDRWNDSRRAAAAVYDRELPRSVARLPVRPEAHDVYHLYPVRIADRDRVASALAREGVATGLHYAPALHHQPPLGDARSVGELEAAAAWSETELSLPMFGGLEAAEVSRVCEALGRVAAVSYDGGP